MNITLSEISVHYLIDFLGLFFGVTAIIVILSSLGKIGGVTAKAFFFVVIGIALQTLSLLSSLIFAGPEVSYSLPIVIHSLLSTVGLFAFVIGAKKFSDLSK